MPQRAPQKREQQVSASALRAIATKKLDTLQKYIGIAFLASAAFGIYLLANDNSLWLLAVSHAYGLVAICVIDIALGISNLFGSSRKLVIISGGWAFLTILLQLGDIATAPQYKMTSIYFASYLFHLWAFDALLIVQVLVIAVALETRSYQKMLVRKKQLTYFDMGLKTGRRDFLQIGGAIGALVAIAGVLGALEAVSSPPQSTNTGGPTGPTSNLPSGAVANVNDLKVGVPAYFDYPSAGYTNMLLKKSDGTVSAVNMICTHVCCVCQYDSSTTDIFCPCHGSVFDQSGNVLRGPALTKLPSIQLSIDASGNIFPVSVQGSSPCGLG